MTQWGLDTLFNPGKRHMDEEKLRRQSVREEVGDNSGGKRIDLDSGRVMISRASDVQASDEAGDEATDEATDEPADDASTQTAATDSSAASPAASTSPASTKRADAELTPAQQRARDRRRRAAKK